MPRESPLLELAQIPNTMEGRSEVKIRMRAPCRGFGVFRGQWVSLTDVPAVNER
jgi:hypothetical protein